MQERAGTEREQEREEAPLVRVLRSIADRIGGKDGMMVRTAAKILDDLGSEAVEGDGVEEVAITDEPMDQETAEMIRSFGATPQDADAPEADDEWPWMRWLEEINAYASNLTELGPVEDERAAQKMADEVHNLTAGLRGFIARRLRRGGGEGEKDWESVREKWDARYMTDPEFHAWVDSVVSRACELERDRLLRSMGRQIEEGGFGGAMQKALSRLWDLAQDCQASGDDDIAVCIYMEVNKMRRLLRDRLRDAPSEGAPTVSDVEDVMHRDFPENLRSEERPGGSGERERTVMRQPPDWHDNLAVRAANLLEWHASDLEEHGPESSLTERAVEASRGTARNLRETADRLRRSTPEAGERDDE